MNNPQSVSNLLEEWNTIKDKLEDHFRERKMLGTRELMGQGIQLFIEFLYVTNESQPVAGDPIPFENFSYKPVNIEERLRFIQSRPNLFHSYRQLAELMVEQEKQFARKNIKKKSSRQDA